MLRALFALVLGLATSTILAAQPASKTLRAGAATSNITPPLGGEIVGGFLPIPSQHIHDELHARCLVLDDGQTRLALVVCDLLGIHRLVSDEARKQIQESCGIPPERVLISCTHTHSAVSALGSDRFKFAQDLDDYQRFVAKRIADGVRRAANELRPARIGFGTAEAPEHVFNRRWIMRPGTAPPNPFGGIDQVKMNPPVASPNLVEPAGPTDPAVSFISLREPDGKPIAVYAAYSLHYVGGVGPGHISSDYYGIYCQRLKQLVAADDPNSTFVAMMANGTSGNVNNINFRQARPRQEAYEQMRLVADDVAAKVNAALAGVKHQDYVTLDSRYREPQIGWRHPTQEQLAWADKVLAAPEPPAGKTDLPRIYAERAKLLAEYPETGPMPLQVLRIGEISVASMPCEVFCEIGLEYKRRTPLKPGFLVSLAHGNYGYLPTPQQHALGGYETWLGTSRMERTASDKMLAELLAMAEEMKP